MEKLQLRKARLTKTSVRRLIDAFDASLNNGKTMRLNGLKNSYQYNYQLNWQDSYTQSKIEDFIKYCEAHGVKIGNYREYNNSELITGRIEFL